MENLLKFLLEPLVKDASSVKIQQVAENDHLNFTVSIPKDDIAKVIGKNGRMIKTIKNLLRIKGIKSKQTVSIEVVEA